MSTGPVARVLLDSTLPQLDHLFDYEIPPTLVERARPGQRVRVPFRSAVRNATGYIVEIVPTAEFSGELSQLSEIVSDVAVLTPEIWQLARTLADRSAGSAGDILRLAIPPRQVRVEKEFFALKAQEGLESDGEIAESDGGGAGPDGEQAEFDQEEADSRVTQELAGNSRTAELQVALESLESLEPAQPRVLEFINRYDPALSRLAEAPLRAALSAVPEPTRLSSGEWVGHWAATLAQAALLLLERGKSAIIAVPDYRDIDQVLSALATMVPAPVDDVVRVDTRQTNPQRYRSFLRLLEERPAIIVGNRSAVYAPAYALGAIMLWDDGDSLHEEPRSPYVHSRNAALIRAEQSGTALVLAAHTRSTEAQRLVEIGWLGEFLPLRHPQPRVILSSHTLDADGFASRARIPTVAWKSAKEASVHGPVLIQVARPGYAPVLACAECDTVARCGHCAGPLGVRRAGETPRCGWCATLASDWRCSNCSSVMFRLVSRGSVRTAEELEKAFPGVRVLVSDGETPRQSVDSRPAIVVATRGAEPTAAEGYAGVVLLDGESMLGRESLRAGEDALRVWSNAIALARPGAPCVLVGVSGQLGETLTRWQQPSYASQELVDRRALRFPPAVRIATVTGPQDAVALALEQVHEIPGVDYLGPTPAENGSMRLIIRFDYRRGEAVATALRAELVRAAIKNRRPRKKGTEQRGNQGSLLRLRFDDSDIQ
ncbi:primosomal protein N' [Lysinibacter sp. HNR]|uniref:primosomal protein N' family DNA-binding protein n=1 Tax=Lysinibacter sp. HNR TaxID=3031408 RepID=UPI002434B6AD|nr:primosomal protein N' [Lysinibacter sp. HNR]WGD36278.1 primosomal protein N' [Lysinibacter sp. HNR]